MRASLSNTACPPRSSGAVWARYCRGSPNRFGSISPRSMRATGQVNSNVNTVIIKWTVFLADHPLGEDQRNVKIIASLCDKRSRQHFLDEKPACVVPGTNSELQIVGSSEFHFLPAGRKFIFHLQLKGADLLLQLDAETPSVSEGVKPFLAKQLPAYMWPTYVGEEHQLGEWLSECPEDTVWTTAPVSDRLMQSLWSNACFTLPSPGSPIVACPNPISRYCLDLTKGCPWLRSKKVRRHKNDFYLTVDADYTGSFWACEETHRLSGKGTWITRELVDALDRCRNDKTDLKVYSIELWEKDGDKLAAAIMALSVGDVFHDYTTATMIRDTRSAGAILTKVVGYLLAECGFTLWYWGFKNPYMAEYDGKFGGMQLENKREFWPKWRRALLGVDGEGQPYPKPQSFKQFVLSKCGAGDGKLYLDTLQ
ncbi:unnamed protein product [Prorocentrum cordatum]|uniref:Uncharacterized protein n=1 Tax=Prorocentrum cordatum TaxID=2364126 RepID=A0ABN9TKT6_9DINO|nr:unnamed protein product [Polarella glacialis]